MPTLANHGEQDEQDRKRQDRQAPFAYPVEVRLTSEFVSVIVISFY
jgi:hypothetical protein